MLGGAAAGGFGLVEEGFELGDDFGMLVVEVLGFAGVFLEVVELAGRIGGGFGEDVGGERGVGEVAVAAGAGVVEIFPMAAADGEVEGPGLVEGEGTDGFVGFSEEEGEEVEAVFGGVAGEIGSGNGGGGGHEVGEGGGLVDKARGDCSGPAGDEWDAVAAFPLVAFHTAPGFGSVVLVVFAHLDDGGDFGAVVAGEEDEGVLGQAEVVDFFDDGADDVVELGDEVAVGAGVGFALEVFAGDGGEVDGLGGVEEEEGFSGVLGVVGFEELQGFVEEDHVDFLDVEVGGDEAGAEVFGVGVFGEVGFVERAGGWDWDAIVLDEGVEPIGGGAAGGAEEVVEAAVDGGVGDGA